MSKTINLNEHISEVTINFFLTLYPLNKNNFDYNLTSEINKFLNNNDYNKYRKIRDELIWNKLIEHSKQTYPNDEYYKITNKGLNFIKQENPNYKEKFN